MAIPTRKTSERPSLQEALESLRRASRERHAAAPGTLAYERADAEERRLGRLVWDLADATPEQRGTQAG